MAQKGLTFDEINPYMSWHVLVETKRVYKGFNVLGKEQ